jgi:hypothetical protein
MIMNKSTLLLIVIGCLLVYICRELHRQDALPEPVKKILPKPLKELLPEPVDKLIPKPVKEEKTGEEFQFPETTSIAQQLTNMVNKVANQEIFPVKNTPTQIIRDNTLSKKEAQANDSVVKVTPKHNEIVTSNPIETSEYYYVGEDTSKAWSEKNVSHHPQYHTSKIADELTPSTGFFDANNQFHDKTSPYAETYLPDRCFKTEDNEVLCKFNNRLHNIPPSLVDPKKPNKLLESIGQGQGDIFKPIDASNVSSVNGSSHQVWEYEGEATRNGGEFYEGVTPSSSGNSDYLSLTDLPQGSYSI